MDIKIQKNNNQLTLYVYGELDEYSASNAKDLIDRVILDNLNIKNFVFDLSGLSFMDSTGIGLLIGRYKKLKQLNIDSFITGANFSTEKVLQISGLYKIMPKC